MNYSETYFELDSEEATHCHHCHLISCVYIKGLVNTKDQSNACMCEMMSKGSKEALIVTHVTHVKRVKRLHYVHNIHLMLCRKGRKIMLYVETRDKHIFLHNFLNIQPFCNPQKVLES